MDQQFKTDYAVNELLAAIATSNTLTAEDVRELKTHLLDSMHQLEQTGLSPEEAFAVAKLRLGNKEMLAVEFEKVNGVSMLRKEWVFIFIGISLAIIFWNLFESSKILFGRFVTNGSLTVNQAAILMVSFYLLSIYVMIRLFKNGPELVDFCRTYLFQKNNFAAAVFAILPAVLILKPTWTWFAGTQSIEVFNNMLEITRSHPAVELVVYGTVPVTIFIATFLATRSVYKPISVGTILTSTSFIYVLVLGVVIETISTLLSRGIFPDSVFAPVIFGTVLLAQMLAFIYYNRQLPYLLLKTACLIFFPFAFEIGASILRTDTNWFTSPLIGFALANFAVTMISFLFALRTNKARIRGLKKD